jgi:hypothetical protein
MYPFKYTLLFNSYFLTKTIPKMAQFLYLKRKSYKKGYSILYKKKNRPEKMAVKRTIQAYSVWE